MTEGSSRATGNHNRGLKWKKTSEEDYTSAVADVASVPQ